MTAPRPQQPDEVREPLTRHSCPLWHRDADGWCLDERPHLAAPSAQPDECAVRGHTPDRLCRRCATPAQPIRDAEEVDR